MRRGIAALRRLAALTDGAAVVEFAVVLPILLLIIWGIVDISRAFQAIDSLTSAVRLGGRTGAAMSPFDQGTIDTLVANDFTPLGAPLDPAQVTVTAPDPNTGMFTVSASYPFEGLTPLLWTFTITRTATFRWEQTTGP
jgi:Flp pilus assembly protein TadG